MLVVQVREMLTWTTRMSTQLPSAFQTSDRLIRHIAGEFSHIILPSDLDYQDLVQEGWVAFLQARQRYQPGKVPLWGYAYPRVRYAMKDALHQSFYRASKRQETVTEDETDLLEELLDPNPPPDVLLIQAETTRQLQSATRGPRHLEVLRLYQEGYTQRSIAKQLQLTEGRVSQILAQIRLHYAFGD